MPHVAFDQEDLSRRIERLVGEDVFGDVDVARIHPAAYQNELWRAAMRSGGGGGIATGNIGAIQVGAGRELGHEKQCAILGYRAVGGHGITDGYVRAVADAEGAYMSEAVMFYQNLVRFRRVLPQRYAGFMKAVWGGALA